MLGTKRQPVKQQGLRMDHNEILPLAEHPDYKAVAEQQDALRSKLQELDGQRSALLEERRFARAPVTFLNSILDDNHSQNGTSLGERINAITDRIAGLQKALQLADQERDRIRGRVSVEVTSSLSTQYREQARKVLRGMLDVQLANESIVEMRGELDAKGYQAGTIIPVGSAPWPTWGQVLDPGSIWRMILLEFQERLFITTDEYAALIAGDLAAFRP